MSKTALEIREKNALNQQVTSFVIPNFCINALWNDDYTEMDAEHTNLLKKFISEKLVLKGLSTVPFGMTSMMTKTKNDICKHDIAQPCNQVHFIKK